VTVGKKTERQMAAAPETTSPRPLFDRDFLEVRFGGSGGQGVILMGVILAVAATRDRRHVVQTQSYGPEARGGYSRSDVIIARHAVDYPQLIGLDLLVALSGEAALRYQGLVRREGIFIFDASVVQEPPDLAADSFGIPFTELALKETGRAQTANILTLGAVVGLTGVVSPESLEKAVLSMVPKGSEEMNRRAMCVGLGLSAEEWRRGPVPYAGETSAHPPVDPW
jgi:2-oxoglutarate ferredoxin oxidoreductase subunit gamma